MDIWSTNQIHRCRYGYSITLHPQAGDNSNGSTEKYSQILILGSCYPLMQEDGCRFITDESSLGLKNKQEGEASCSQFPSTGKLNRFCPQIFSFPQNHQYVQPRGKQLRIEIQRTKLQEAIQNSFIYVLKESSIGNNFPYSKI